VTVSEPIGIAEYSNANFFSRGTIFGTFSSGDYPYPNWDSVSEDINVTVISDPRDPTGQVKRKYFIKNAHGDTGYRLSTAPFTAKYAIDWGILYEQEFPAILDEYVYRDYAERLIPRAVGYSAGLLDYFFRGKMEVACLPIFSDDGTNTFLNTIRIRIKNMTAPGETMSDGTFALICRYNDAGEEKSVRIFNVASGELQYDNETELDFYLPMGPEDDRITMAEYQSGVTCTLVFKGTLGNETDAVVGKVFTLGEEVKFGEAWDNGLTGNHPWDHIIAEPTPPNGTGTNIVENGLLTKENIREAGSIEARFNESIRNLPDSGILITPNTYIEFKIDESAVTPFAPETYSWQDMVLGFNDHGWPSMAYYSFTPGELTGGNIYQLLLNAGVEIPDQLNLDEIGFGQGLEELAEPSTVEHSQHMKIDFLRIIEEKQNQ